MDVYSFGESFGTTLDEAFGIKEHASGSGTADRAAARAARDAAERASDPTPPSGGRTPPSPSPPSGGSSGRRPRPGNPPRPPIRRRRRRPIIVNPVVREIVNVPRYSYTDKSDLVKILIAISIVLGIALFLRYK
tara:strand:+ start:1509 stop:1910 length:402 start_codon:yes stop_codon:yes gene_type:complete